jgi:hypothetical protein
MQDAAFYSLISNISAAYLSGLVETLAYECAENGDLKPLIVNLDPEVQFLSRSGRWHREVPMARYGDLLKSCDVPLLTPTGAAEMFEDAARTRSSAVSLGRSFVFVDRRYIPSGSAPLFDSICLALALDSSSVPFVYDIVRSMIKTGCSTPLRVLIAGDSRIERCAEFYTDLVRELDTTSAKPSDISFAGHMFFDPEEEELAAGFGIPVIEAFQKGVLRGQARYIAHRLFAPDFSEITQDFKERQKRFAAFLRH